MYTALFGGYESLTEQPVALDSAADFICFTDDPNLTSETWQIRVIDQPMLGDTVRSSRLIKIRGHENLDHYDQTLWIDNSVLLKCDPVGMLREWLAGYDMALPRHSYRRSVASEFDAVNAAGRDDPARIYEQLEVYSKYVPEMLDAPVLWTALLARHRSPKVAEAMTIWADQVMRHSRRDQLSIRFALQRAGLEPLEIVMDNWESAWHRWPVTAGRTAGSEYTEAIDFTHPPVATIAKLHGELERTEARLAAVLETRTWRMREFARTLARGMRDKLRP